MARRRSRCIVRPQAIGFDFGESGSAERSKVKTIQRFGFLASTLLVYQNIFKGSVGEAFIGAIAACNKYQASNKDVAAAYGKFFQILVTAGYQDWQSYVLDQILLGRDNNFARLAAQDELDSRAPLLKAVAYDLDVLQQLCISVAELADFVGEMAPTVGGYYVTAGSSAATRPAPRRGEVAVPSDPPVVLDINKRHRYVQCPASKAELQAWRDAVAGKDSWSDAAALLLSYYRTYGFGITSRNTALRWVRGAFEDGSDAQASPPSPAASPAAAAVPASVVFSANAAPLAAITSNTLAHCRGLPAHHVLLCGPPGSAKSWLLWNGTLAAGRELGVRVVEVSAGEASNLLDIARGCARYPRVRFVLVLDNLDLPVRGALAADLKWGLARTGASGWPSNTLLYCAVSAESTVRPDDPLVALFGRRIVTTPIEYGEAFETAVAQALGVAPGKVAPGRLAAAAQFAAGAGGPSLRAAVQFAVQCAAEDGLADDDDVGDAPAGDSTQ